ncbi:MAG: transcriptional regulator [Ignavibacteria bacterium]|nr:transcriptional regulator [Ignavibacteria bacterium]
MKPLLHNWNAVFDNRVRLAAMALLVVRGQADFIALRDELGVTDGNLASHLAVLERERYLRVSKKFAGKKPLTTYAVTEAGRRAFAAHLDALEALLRPGAGQEHVR